MPQLHAYFIEHADDSKLGEHVMLTRLLNTKGTQLTQSMLFSESTFGYARGPNMVMASKCHLLVNYFGLASLFTLDIVVDYLVNPRVFGHICFY